MKQDANKYIEKAVILVWEKPESRWATTFILICALFLGIAAIFADEFSYAVGYLVVLTVFVSTLGMLLILGFIKKHFNSQLQIPDFKKPFSVSNPLLRLFYVVLISSCTFPVLKYDVAIEPLENVFDVLSENLILFATTFSGFAALYILYSIHKTIFSIIKLGFEILKKITEGVDEILKKAITFVADIDVTAYIKNLRTILIVGILMFLLGWLSHSQIIDSECKQNNKISYLS